MEISASQEPGIEDVLGRMDAIVARLERQDTGLEEAMTLYAEGVRLARETGERLRAAELRITELRAGMNVAEDPGQTP